MCLIYSMQERKANVSYIKAGYYADADAALTSGIMESLHESFHKLVVGGVSS